MVPFITERVWQDIVRPVSPDAPESVHMADWPEADEAVIDDALNADVALVRRLVELGRAARAASGVRTRQPLARALVAARGWDSLPAVLRAEISDELNVAEVAALSESEGKLVDLTAKPNFRALGRRFGKDTQQVATAIAAADAGELAAALRGAGRASLSVAGLGDVEVSADDVVLTETPREGWAVAREGETVALDLTLTDALVRAGLAREVVRLIQEARKASGYDVTDRVEIAWQAAGKLATALAEHADTVAAEVLATTVHDSLTALDGEPDHTDNELGLTVRLRRVGGGG
jgi:isoleucyl-tRNA synthetase